ncbi:negative regulator of P-body association isoform X1 [Microcebus murinus]|uniref:negative regulator of P-body association isoform X1 n=1 Tax=Microcebus murinus TaxID=30608 RepID=UPI003F6AFFEF
MGGAAWRQGQRRVSMSRNGFFACPGFRSPKDNRRCGGIANHYCAEWDCVTTNDGEWKWQVEPRLVEMSYVQPCTRDRYAEDCNLIRVKFTEEGKRDKRWITGLSWGICLYRRPYLCSLMYIKLKVTLLPVAVGPNQVLHPRPVTVWPGPVAPRTPSNTGIPQTQPTGTGSPRGSLSNEEPTDPLWKMLTAAYETLNRTNPNATKACWLCYDVRPPFYEAVGLATYFNLSSEDSPKTCQWDRRGPGLTLQSVLGKGTCLGTVPPSHAQLCAEGNRTVDRSEGTKWVIPGPSGWWICSQTGLTPCLSLSIFNGSKDYCIMVLVFPKIIYHTEETMYEGIVGRRVTNLIFERKREPITAITLATLFGLGAIGAGTGISSLAMQQRGFHSLRAAVDEDIARIEESISHLEKSLTSLSEVVLQNRRGLDLVFLQQGGLCAALREECCFYADHTGVVRESMARVREGLARCKREHEQQAGWFESWFNSSPWLTTLISTLLDPLIILLLVLTFGPCLVNRLATFVKERINTVQLLVLQQQYQQLQSRDIELEHLRDLEDEQECSSAT